jgi:hypothetical protein
MFVANKLLKDNTSDGEVIQVLSEKIKDYKTAISNFRKDNAGTEYANATDDQIVDYLRSINYLK